MITYYFKILGTLLTTHDVLGGVAVRVVGVSEGVESMGDEGEAAGRVGRGFGKRSV